jgi:hypothetical protein
MRSQKKPLWRQRIVFALSTIALASLTMIGCVSSYPGNYKLGLQGTAPKFNISNWTVEHNLFNNTAQRMDKEDWEEDWPG